MRTCNVPHDEQRRQRCAAAAVQRPQADAVRLGGVGQLPRPQPLQGGRQGAERRTSFVAFSTMP